MTAKPVVRRFRARQDIEATVAYLQSNAAENAATAFLMTLESAIEQIARFPAAASTRYADRLNLPGLRNLPLKSSPYVVFYIETSTQIEVLRILHGARDIVATLEEP